MVRQRATTFWSTDQSLTVLLVLLAANIFLVPLAQFETWGRLVGRAILSLVIISGVIATVRERRVVLLAVVLTVGSILIGWIDFGEANLYLQVSNDFYSLIFIGFLIALISRQVFRSGPITVRRVRGAVAIYLLLGLMWAVAYEVVERIHPGSFQVSLPHRGANLPQLGYFSFTTLTTLGFGDILPVSPLARSLVILEALVGQLFPAILIARLVGMELESSHNPLPNDGVAPAPSSRKSG
jgi:hypothetical protein